MTDEKRTQPGQTICAYCGMSEGHSPRCSVTKGLAPEARTPSPSPHEMHEIHVRRAHAWCHRLRHGQSDSDDESLAKLLDEAYDLGRDYESRMGHVKTRIHPEHESFVREGVTAESLREAMGTDDGIVTSDIGMDGTHYPKPEPPTSDAKTCPTCGVISMTGEACERWMETGIPPLGAMIEAAIQRDIEAEKKHTANVPTTLEPIDVACPMCVAHAGETCSRQLRNDGGVAAWTHDERAASARRQQQRERMADVSPAAEQQTAAPSDKDE